jgi:Glycosyl transferase family 2.
MNVAFTLGTGKYLLITHDDDIMMSNMLEEEVKILESYPKSVIVGVNAKLIDENGNVIKEKGNKHEDDLVFKKYEYVNAFLNKGLFLYCPTVLMRRSFFSENNLKFDLSYGPSFAWDNFLWFRINLLYDVELISLEKQLYYYRIHQNQASHKKYFMNSLLYKKTIQFLGENLEKDRAKSFVEMIIFRMAVNSSQSLNEKIISQKEFIQDIHDSKILLKEWELDGFISIIKLAGIRYISYSILHKIKQLYVYFKKLFL